jgi:hypothetical protein
LVIVVDVFILLDIHFSRNLMAVGGEVAVLLSRRCWLGKCRFVCLLVSHHMVVRSSEGLLKCAIGGATKYLVFGDCKSVSPGRNKFSFLTEPLVSSKEKKYLSTLFFLCSWGGLKTSF